jgi:dTDP-glucose 4,6-dehydratase
LTKVLITGAGGFAGHHFFEHVLVNTDWDIVATDSFRHTGTTDRIREVLEGGMVSDWASRVEVYTHDLTAPFSAQGVDRLRDVDYMVCFASLSNVDESISAPVPFVRNNVDVVLNCLELAREVKPKNFVWISTDEVYGPIHADDATGHAEWSKLLPSNPYAGSKAAQESIAISYWRTYGVPLQIINCMNMIGERQDKGKYVPMTIGKVLRDETVSIHGSPGNIGSRFYIHSRSLADGILFLIKNKKPAVFGENSYDGEIVLPDRYNVVPPDRFDNLELARKIAAYVGKPLKYELVDFHRTRPGHDPHYGLDGTKLAELGWEMPIPFDESLKKLVSWTLEHPEWLL